MIDETAQLNLADRSEFAALYENTHRSVFRFIYGVHGGPRQDVEDLTAETYIRAWNARDRFTGDEGDALSWLFTIARRLVIDAHRRRGRRGIPKDIDDMVLETGNPGPESQTLSREQARILWALLDGLPEDHREILVLRYMLGWQVKRIAQHFDMRPNTVTKTIYRVLDRLKRDWPSDPYTLRALFDGIEQKGS